MIIYNMRERGALEYDKFALNIFQISNMVNHHVNKIQNSKITSNIMNEEYENFEKLCEKFNSYFNDIINFSEEQYLKYIAPRTRGYKK